jgi:hypothetical protein
MMAWKREAVRVICWGRVKVDIFSVLFDLILSFGLDLILAMIVVWGRR